MTLHFLANWIEANIELILFTSVSIFVASIILIPLIIIYLPPNYFVQKSEKKGNVFYCWSKIILKNILGVILISIGLLMVVLPGPGIIMMIIGLMLVQFPGKRRLKNYFLGNQILRKQLNWIRNKGNKDPFIFSSGKNR